MLEDIKTGVELQSLLNLPTEDVFVVAYLPRTYVRGIVCIVYLT